MLVKDIVLKVCDFLEGKQLAQSIKNNQELTDEEADEVETFVKCFNLVRNEIATEMIANTKIEKVKTANGRVEFSSLSSKVIEILAVKDQFGNNVHFDVFADHLQTNENMVEVKYNASPEELTFEDEFSSVIPERVFAYGIVREYFFLQSLYDDASAWEERFKNSMQALERRKHEIVIPRRRWM